MKRKYIKEFKVTACNFLIKDKLKAQVVSKKKG